MTDDQAPRLSQLADDLARADAAAGAAAGDEARPVIVLGNLSSASFSTDIAAPTDRRAFLTRASALSLAIPGLGAALAACGPDGAGTRDSAGARAAGGSTAAAGSASQHLNSNSRLDTAVLRNAPHASSSATSAASQGATSAVLRRYDPASVVP